MSLVSDIKNQIKAHLDSLKTAGVLGDVIVHDYKLSIFDYDFAAYPAAVLTTPSIEGEYFTSGENLRTHSFEIVVISKGENVASITEIEDLAERILDEFDKDDTLAGTAIQVEPATTTPEAVTSRGKTYIVFSVIIRAKGIKSITI
jgi:hypothetical protein